ncbi:transposase [Flavobacterium sp. NG2]|uniref:transposase n=1 Tax=Flavobacterium sp. NG2 TaxID=3097547 RepID=UPI002A836075|nr:transposase [Flavobacterium sp. NG2]WPR71042.1 transposase [Flavobacterium sp. NG2]
MKSRKRNRMLGYDYSSDNLYFVTICVEDRKCCFGYVGTVGTGRDLSVHAPLFEHAPLSVHSPEPVHSPQPEDMPQSEDELHSNLQMESKESNNQLMILNQFGEIAYKQLEWLEEQYEYVVLHSSIVMPNHVHAIIEIDSSLVSDATIKIKSLSELVGAYKTTSSKLIRRSGLESFAWHRSFHDHIIRNEQS